MLSIEVNYGLPIRDAYVFVFRSLSRTMSQSSVTSMSSSKAFQSSSITDQSTTSAHSTGTQNSRETTHYVKQSLLDAKVISCLAPWIMCGIYEIQVIMIIAIIMIIMRVITIIMAW